MLETENSIYKVLNVSDSCHHNYYVVQDARFRFVRHRHGRVQKAGTPPTTGFVIVNTDDDSDDEKLGARYDMKKREQTRRDNGNVTRNLHLVYFFLAAFSADFVTKKRRIIQHRVER